MRLIDADALIDELTQRCCKNCIKRMGIKNGKQRMIYEIGDAPCRACEVDDIKAELDDAPTIEAEPVRHGKWIYVEDVPLEDGQTEYDREAWYQCSKCDAYDLRLKDCHADYCWSCGAKMDEVNDDK